MKNRKSQGFTMIEVLITVVITAIGLLGLGAMQLVSMKNINNTQYRSLATIYAYDMAERMRSNQAGVLSGAYNNVTGNETAISCTAFCSGSEVAQRDAFEWNQFIKNGANGDLSQGALPNARGEVGSLGNRVFEITVTWDEQDRDNTGGVITTESFVLRVRI